MKTFSVILAASLCLGAVSAHAQQANMTPEQARAALNSQEAMLARQQLDQDIANQQAYRAAVAARESEIERQKQIHEAAMANYDAQVQRYHAALHEWHDENAMR
jgi:hypothetical protein